MTLVKWDPWRDLEAMFDGYVRAADWMWPGLSWPTTSGGWMPRVDIGEGDDAFVVKAELPDVKIEDVQLTLERGVLTLRGVRRREKDEDETRYHRIERCYGSFCRSFKLSEQVDEALATATFKDGVLTVRVPKTSAAIPETVALSVK